MSLQILKEMLEDADLFGYIRAGAYATEHDRIAELIFPKLSEDLSLSQIQDIVWDSFYLELCQCTIGNETELWVLDRDQARVIIGDPERFKGIALNIRHHILGL